MVSLPKAEHGEDCDKKAKVQAHLSLATGWKRQSTVLNKHNNRLLSTCQSQMLQETVNTCERLQQQTVEQVWECR